MTAIPLSALTCFFCILQNTDLHQNNIISNLLHIAERNHIFLLPSKYSAKAAWPRYDQMSDASCFFIKFHIPHIPQAFTVTNIDHFFFFKSKMRIPYTYLSLSVWYAHSSLMVPKCPCTGWGRFAAPIAKGPLRPQRYFRNLKPLLKQRHHSAFIGFFYISFHLIAG